MEKSLGAGNHSEVWRKIITGVEDMHDFLKNSGRKKEQFRKDALKFCQRFWDEEKHSAQFSFTQFNKDIIDAIMYLIGDKKDRYETHKEALWFYEGMQSATEGEFQDEFDQETDNSAVNEMLKERDEILDKLIDLCLQLDEHEKLRKYKNDKLALYKGILVRVDFVGEKEYNYDKETLKSKVEQLYQDVGQTKDIPKFRENLLSTWQTQWEEGKGGEKMNEIGVGRKRTINGILQLCKQLKQLAMFRRYGKEALSFYEDVWEEKQATMKPPEMKKFLLNIKQLASSIGDHKSERLYDAALQTLEEPGKQPGAMLRPKAKQAAPKSEEKEEEEEEVVVGSEEEIVVESEETIEVGPEEEIIEVGSEEEEIIEVGSDEEMEMEVGAEEETEVGAEDETEVGAEAGEAENRCTIFKDTVTKQGGHWDLKKVAVHVLFPPDAVSKDTAMALLRWKSSVCSPPLQENEAIVSNVVELSTDIPEGFGFNKEVTLAISHSAADLKGYEVVVKKLIDKENDEWVDVDKTVDFRSLSGKGCFSLIRYF
ncbi:hypothetical protein OS493_037027 [Desmophyllum pertusum]|uniref:ZU5 domain-containing protein n=1 Tax=Desmophyllum pertusum TaxID=174260 RepID=A0A9X0CCL4_9CNID|nr:hypothetical protein OS493_037027 [Desmophyllum pertusum]